MFTTALFTIAKTWKQPKCPSTEEWPKKRWYIYTMEYYSAIKRNEIMAFIATWIDLEILLLSEAGQKEKEKHHMITLISGVYFRAQVKLSTEEKNMDFENRLVVSRGRGLGRSGIEWELGVIRHNLE